MQSGLVVLDARSHCQAISTLKSDYTYWTPVQLAASSIVVNDEADRNGSVISEKESKVIKQIVEDGFMVYILVDHVG